MPKKSQQRDQGSETQAYQATDDERSVEAEQRKQIKKLEAYVPSYHGKSGQPKVFPQLRAKLKADRGFKRRAILRSDISKKNKKIIDPNYPDKIFSAPRTDPYAGARADPYYAASAPRPSRTGKAKKAPKKYSPTHDDWGQMSVAELRTMCNDRGLSCKSAYGDYLSKADLIRMLEQ